MSTDLADMTIIVVEDDPNSYQPTLDLLRMAGAESVYACTTGDSAIALAYAQFKVSAQEETRALFLVSVTGGAKVYLNGENVSLSDFKGKIVILDFWATWCPPCVTEIPHFIELYEQYKDQGFAMVGVSLDREGVDVVKSFVQKYGINYPILMSDGQVEKAYGGITSIPTTFVIDSANNIRRKYIGYRDKSVFEADIKTFLANSE